MNSHLFLQYGLRDLKVQSFPYAFWWIHWLLECTQVLSCFCQIRHSHNSSSFCRAWQEQLMFPTSYARSSWFFEFCILGVDEINSSKFSCVVKMNLFFRPLFAFPSAWCSFPLTSRTLAIDDLAWM